MITYGHEKFIGEAIEGVLMQRGDFEIELVIANDCSPDNTDEIVHEIIKNHPKSNWINYTRHSYNKGMMANFTWALNQAKGKYIALCEGDDYWTDTYKIQKQYDFLESNPGYFLCAHRVIEKEGDNFSDVLTKKIEYKFIDFSASGSCNGIYTSSMMFRNTEGILDVFLEDWTLKLDGGDLLILFLSTYNGQKVKLMLEVMGVYRIHDGGVWSSSTTKKKVKDAIITNSLYTNNLTLSEVQRNQIIFGLSHRILHFYSAQFKNRFLRKVVSIVFKMVFITGPGTISNRFIGFLSKRVLSNFD